MQRPTARSWDRRLNLVGVVEIARNRSVMVAPTSEANELPSAQEILDAVLGSVSTSASGKQHTLAMWAGELTHVCLQARDSYGIEARMRAARIIRIIDIWVETYVLQDDAVQITWGESLGSLIDRMAELGAEMCNVSSLRITAEASTAVIERQLDRLVKEYTSLVTLLVAGR